MDRQHVMQGLFILWVAGMAWSAWSVFGMAPTGDGLVRGINKIFGFLVGQAGAGLCAILLLILGWGRTGRADKWLARGPAVMSLIAALIILGLIAWMRHMQPEPNIQPPGKVTAPAAVAD